METVDSETRASQSYSKKSLILLFSLDSQSIKLLRRHELTPLTFPPFCAAYLAERNTDLHGRRILRRTGAYPYYILGKFSADPELLI